MKIVFYYLNRHGLNKIKLGEQDCATVSDLDLITDGVTIGVRSRYRKGFISAVAVNYVGQEVEIKKVEL